MQIDGVDKWVDKQTGPVERVCTYPFERHPPMVLESLDQVTKRREHVSILKN